ncbi:MAG TPA: tetratricopeptide repeat protein, partial [Mariprofundaceae bacterium]|nr:tetratricopeptide repeat protein [Mariprofundaceae bacterium]
ASAASMYESAVLEQDKSKQQTLLSDVARDYRGTSYAAMAQMLLARLDTANAEKHLQAIITSSKAMDAWKWQARLDLAELYLENKDAAKAAAVLADPVGPAYEQLRQYLLAKSSSDAAARKDHLQKALDAQSYDADLKQKIERMLADSAS